ncbi:MAG: AraC family transcriptional regulator [Paenibacillus sp.]|jgi:predicted transcriptional regulator YdeE|nr:AraC family transcriptional regulator [Paenibacillus sp.]
MKEMPQHRPPEDYRPVVAPKALQLIRGGLEMKPNVPEIVVVERPEMKAIVMRTIASQRDVRQAWKEIENAMADHSGRLNTDEGLVFIPEWQWSTRVETLWVGVAASSLDHVPDGFETITIPAKKYAKTTVRGDRSQMDRTYDSLWKWFESGGLERDIRKGSYGYEMNRLTPINPFHIPADVIDYFDFDIYAPIK